MAANLLIQEYQPLQIRNWPLINSRYHSKFSKVKLNFTNQIAGQFGLNAGFLKKEAQPYEGF